MNYSETLKRQYGINKIWQQLLLWLSIYLIYSGILAFTSSSLDPFIFNLMNVPLYMMAYYLLKHIQLPYLFNRDKRVLFILSLVASSAVLFLLNLAGRVFILDSIFERDSLEFMLSIHSFLMIIIRMYAPAFAILSWESYYQRNIEKERIRLLENEKIATELKFLKAQINPHFLFNTLNNLYSYVVTESPKAPEMIQRLSGILDYILNKSKTEQVALQDEVNVISDFIGLEQVRYGDRLNVDYQFAGNLSTPISPLILLSIVENAFKHGASGDIDKPSIKISITADQENIKCTVWNTKSKTLGELNDAYKKGIGLTNIKRQLDLSYPERHRLNIDNQETFFNLTLTISNKI